MKITFLLPFLNHRGGTQFVMELSDILAGWGDDVTVVWPTRLKPLPGPLSEIEYLWRAPAKMLSERWWSTRAKVLPVPTLAERYIPRSDVIVATQWRTAEWASGYSPSRGRRVYYVFEPEIHKDPEACVRTYKMPFDKRLAISEWTRRQLEFRYGQQLDGVTPIGLDLARFPARRAAPAQTVRTVGMVYDPHPKKGFADGWAAFLAVRARHPHLKLNLIGTPRHGPALPDFVVPHFHATHAEKVALMQSTDVWVSSSREEGFGLPPLEAMACGSAVVTTNVGGTPYFARHGETALVVAPGDRPALEAALERMVTDGALRRKVTLAGIQTARGLTMQRTAQLFRQAVLPLAPAPAVTADEVASAAGAGIAFTRS